MYQVHFALYELFLGVGKIQDSMEHYRAFHEIREDVNHEDMERKVKNRQRLFEAEQTAKENAIIKAQKQEIEHKNKELSDTIEELTITKISRKAKAITLFIAVLLLVIETIINHYVVSRYAENSFIVTLLSEAAIVILLKPIEKAVEHYLLGKIIENRRAAMAEARKLAY